jgi:hypothetical protein
LTSLWIGIFTVKTCFHCVKISLKRMLNVALSFKKE